MRIKTLSLGMAAALTFVSISAFAQAPCGSERTPEQQQRRWTVITFARAFNTAQLRFRQEQKRWGELSELTQSAAWMSLVQGPSAATLTAVTPTAPGGEILPGFHATVITAAKGYALVVRDKQDPCGQTLTTTHEGLIIIGAPLR